jgi:hypothetical protein
VQRVFLCWALVPLIQFHSRNCWTNFFHPWRSRKFPIFRCLPKIAHVRRRIVREGPAFAGRTNFFRPWHLRRLPIFQGLPEIARIRCRIVREGTSFAGRLRLLYDFVSRHLWTNLLCLWRSCRLPIFWGHPEIARIRRRIVRKGSSFAGWTNFFRPWRSRRFPIFWDLPEIAQVRRRIVLQSLPGAGRVGLLIDLWVLPWLRWSRHPIFVCSFTRHRSWRSC